MAQRTGELEGRTVELSLLLVAGLLLCATAWQASDSRFSQEGERAGPTAYPHSNVLRASPADLRASFALAVPESRSTAVVEQVVQWRSRLSRTATREVVLADLLRLPQASPQPGSSTSSAERLLTSAEYSALRPVLTVRDPRDVQWHWLLSFAVLLLSFLAVHLSFRASSFQGSQLLLPLVQVLCGTAAIVQFSFTDPLRERLLYFPFVMGVALGCGGLFAAARLVRLSMLLRFKYLTVTGALGLAGLLMAFGTGPAGTDTRINLFGLFQPAEPIKLLVVVFLAAYFASRDVELRRFHAGSSLGIRLPRPRDVLPVGVLVAGTLALFFFQRDLGPALIVYLVFLGLFMAASRRVVLGVGGLALVIFSFWTTHQFRLLETVSTRIEMWLSPWDNDRPGGVQLAESLWALASGGFWGTGLGAGESRYIPAGHTDLMLASVGEIFGFPGVAAILVALLCLVAVAIYEARRAARPFAMYLGLGLALLLGVQTCIITAGTLGLVPLTGVSLPFMSYGKSAMIAQMLMVGLALNASASPPGATPVATRIGRAAFIVPALLGMMLVAVGWRAYLVMAVDADAIVARGALSPQADGVRRFAYNRRLVAFAGRVTRGSILDRSGFPLATSRTDELGRAAARLTTIGAEAPNELGGRTYPLAGSAVQLLGHTHAYWTDPRTVERAMDRHLRGYPFDERVVVVDGNRIVQRDYSALVPAFRRHGWLGGRRTAFVVARDNDVVLSLDATLQVAAMSALERHMPTMNGVPRTNGAAVVLEAATGDVLVAASVPTYDPNALSPGQLDAIYAPETRTGYDRARHEVYAPGSAFKIVTAAAALEAGWLEQPDAARSYDCRHATLVPWEHDEVLHRRRVQDDDLERAHGPLTMGRALAESCNLYFAWTATQIGAEQLFAVARSLGLALRDIPNAGVLNELLPDHAYGQARVTASPLEMATVAAAVVNGGYHVAHPLVREPLAGPAIRQRVLRTETAETLREWLVDAVTVGTGRRAAVDGVVVGGKTGTAQNGAGDRASHSWFVGFAYPTQAGPRDAVAFAVIIENGGYGGRAAAEVAREIVEQWFSTGPVPSNRERT